MLKNNELFGLSGFKSKLSSLVLVLPLLLVFEVSQGQSFNLQQLLKENKLVTPHLVTPFNDNGKSAVSSMGVVWIKNTNFLTGTIEIDLRGKDIVQKSFLGVAFHGVDTITYDAIYFRPFNFRSADPVRK